MYSVEFCVGENGGKLVIISVASNLLQCDEVRPKIRDSVAQELLTFVVAFDVPNVNRKHTQEQWIVHVDGTPSRVDYDTRKVYHGEN